MSNALVLEARVRDRAGKGAARAARRAGFVPAVIYGDKQSPALISVDPKTLGLAVRTRGFFSSPLTLNLDGKNHLVMPRDVQLDPISDKPLHADFLRVTPDSTVRVFVPVRFVNHVESPGIKRGGVLNIVRREIEFYSQVKSVPNEIAVDLAGLEITDSVHISMVKLPAGIRPVIQRDFTICSIAPPTARVEEARAAAAAAAAAAAPAADAAAPGAAPAAPGAAPAAGAKPAAGAAPAAAGKVDAKTGTPAKGAAPAKADAKPAAAKKG